jgi:hypothetical protein
MPDTTDGREVLTARLRALADWLDASPGVPLSPYCSVQVNTFADNMDDARTARASAPGGWEKDSVGNYFAYTRAFLPDDSGKWEVSYALNVNKAATCERVQTGVKHVEEHDEPVFEWKCVPEPAAHDPAGHIPDCTGEQPSGDCPACETGGATSAWEHPHG